MGKSILTIDVDPDILLMINLVLSELGHSVTVSQTGEEAERLNEYKHDLILLDICLNGFPWTDWLYEDQK